MIIVFAIISLFIFHHPIQAELSQDKVGVLLREAQDFVLKKQYGSAVERLTFVLLQDPGNILVREKISQVSQHLQTTEMGATSLPFISQEERSSIVGLAYKSLRQTSPDLLAKLTIEATDYEREKFYVLACRTYLKILALPGLKLETKHGLEKQLRNASNRVNLKIESMPENVRGFYRDAFTLMNVGDWDGSIENWQKYSEKASADKEAQKLLSLPESVAVLKEKEWLNKGNKALQEGKLEEAKTSFQKVLGVNPQKEEALSGMEEVQNSINRIRKKAIVSKYIKEAENLVNAGENNKAFDLLLDALKESPADPKILALIHGTLKNIPIQTVQSKQIIATSQLKLPSSPVIQQIEREKIPKEKNRQQSETHYQRGLVYYGLRNFREAAGEWQIAVKLDPTYQKAVRALERVHSDLGIGEK